MMMRKQNRSNSPCLEIERPSRKRSKNGEEEESEDGDLNNEASSGTNAEENPDQRKGNGENESKQDGKIKGDKLFDALTNPRSSFIGYDHVVHGIDNPKPQESSAPSFTTAGTNGDMFVLVMVGLPARGKTYIARRLRQYLRFFHGAPTEVFNVGNYRRKLVATFAKHDFFDPANKENVKLRNRCATLAMEDMKNWLKSGKKDLGRVAIYDATNTTVKRRNWILAELKEMIQSRRHVIFIESVCNDEKIVNNNILATKTTMPDYEGIPAEEAVADFKKRIAHYQTVYQPISDNEADMTWVKLVDGGRQVAMNNIQGFLPGRIVQLLMNLHTIPRPIYLTRHGESEYNHLGKIGGDSSLSEEGERYAAALAKFVHKHILNLNEDGSFPDPSKRVAPHARLWTSSLKRTKETAKYIVHHECEDGWIIMRPRVWRALDEIYAGVFDGMTYDEIKDKAPNEFDARQKDKLGYRYPRGESYLDVIQRLDPVIHEVERQRDPILIVGHQGILRIIYSYFMGNYRDDAPFVSIPLNTVIKLEPGTYLCQEERIELAQMELKEPPSH